MPSPEAAKTNIVQERKLILETMLKEKDKTHQENDDDESMTKLAEIFDFSKSV